MNIQNILYLDDELQFLEMYSSFIDEWGHKVNTYNTPDSAFNELKQNGRYDILLVDYKMPEMNGIDFLNKISQFNFFNVKKLCLFSTMVKDPEVINELEKKLSSHYSKVTCLDKSPNTIKSLKDFLDSSMT